MKIEQYWGIIYAIMKSLGVKELEIDKKYFEIDINKFVNMYYHDTLNGNIKVELREKNNEVEEKKKIPEKIDIYVEDDEKWIQVYNYDGTIPLDKKALSNEELVIIKTLNKVIDYLNSKGE